MWKIEELKIGMRGQRRVTNGGHSCASGVYHKPCPVLQHTVTFSTDEETPQVSESL